MNIFNNPTIQSNLTTYIGQKGYTLFKKELTKEQENILKNELIAKPFVQGAPCAINITYPVYRESENKIYIPRFFGEKHFGYPKVKKIKDGDDINISFVGNLRDTQIPAVNAYINHVSKNETSGGGGLLELGCAAGKCLQINTPILMFDGTIKMVQDIKIGDILMGDNSTPRNVLSLARGREIMYKIIPQRGQPYVVNESHILSLKCIHSNNNTTINTTNNNKMIDKIIDISVLDYLKLPKYYNGKNGVLRGFRVPIHFEEKPLPCEPYIIGYWLGKGNTNDIILPKNDSNIFKHIPFLYKCNSRENRMKLLAGLIDSIGCLNKKNNFEISEKSEKMMDDIIYLVRSLGFACYKKIKTVNKKSKGEEKFFKITITGKGLHHIPTLIIKPTFSQSNTTKSVLNYKIRLEKLDVDDYYGFEIDGNRRFVPTSLLSGGTS